MASPHTIVFFLYDATSATSAPLAGATPVFDIYKDTAGNNLSQPAISAIGGGAYKFTPVFAANTSIVAIIDGGAGSAPRRQAMYLRPEDFDIDIVGLLQKYEEGRWKIHGSGPDANRLVLYDVDGLTALKKFDLKDVAGVATPDNPYERVPV